VFLLHRLLLLLLLWDGMVSMPDLLAGDWLALAAADDRAMRREKVDTSYKQLMCRLWVDHLFTACKCVMSGSQVMVMVMVGIKVNGLWHPWTDPRVFSAYSNGRGVVRDSDTEESYQDMCIRCTRGPH
jgi:hypothetical protein